MGCSVSIHSKRLTSISVFTSETGGNRHVAVIFDKNIDKFKCDVNSTNVIFIFGGPSSLKGTFVEMLVTCFHFDLINCGDLILTALPQRVGQRARVMSDLREILMYNAEATELITLEWIISLVKTRISQTTHGHYLVDLLPNLTQLFQLDITKQQESISEVMQAFESEFACPFAANFINSEEGFMVQYRKHPSQRRYVAAEGEEGADRTKEFKRQMREDYTNDDWSDEMELTRLQRRDRFYRRNVMPLLDYFESTERLVHVEVLAKNMTKALSSFYTFMSARGFRTFVSESCVVAVLSKTKTEADAVATKLGMMTVQIQLSDISEIYDELESHIECLREFLLEHVMEKSNSRFCVILDTEFKEDLSHVAKIREGKDGKNTKKKNVLFHEGIGPKLEEYLRNGKIALAKQDLNLEDGMHSVARRSQKLQLLFTKEFDQRERYQLSRLLLDEK